MKKTKYERVKELASLCLVPTDPAVLRGLYVTKFGVSEIYAYKVLKLARRLKMLQRVKGSKLIEHGPDLPSLDMVIGTYAESKAIKKSRQRGMQAPAKLAAAVSAMPPLSHFPERGIAPFDPAKSEVLKWLISNETVNRWILERLKSWDLIRFNPDTELWHGITVTPTVQKNK